MRLGTRLIWVVVLTALATLTWIVMFELTRGEEVAKPPPPPVKQEDKPLPPGAGYVTIGRPVVPPVPYWWLFATPPERRPIK